MQLGSSGMDVGNAGERNTSHIVGERFPVGCRDLCRSQSRSVDRRFGSWTIKTLV
jgi:hypothetical protein